MPNDKKVINNDKKKHMTYILGAVQAIVHLTRTFAEIISGLSTKSGLYLGNGVV